MHLLDDAFEGGVMTTRSTATVDTAFRAPAVSWMTLLLLGAAPQTGAALCRGAVAPTGQGAPGAAGLDGR